MARERYKTLLIGELHPARRAALITCAWLALGATAVLAAGDAPGVVVEEALARDRSLAPGDTVWVNSAASRDGAVPFVVTGAFAPPPDPSALGQGVRRVLLPITAVEELTGARDRVTRVVVALEPGADPDSVVAALNADPLGYRAYTSGEVARESSQTFEVIASFHDAISILSILAGAVFLAAIVLLQVQELRRPLGVLRVIGISRWRIFRIVVGETLILANLGAVIGVAVSFGVSGIVNRYYQHYFDTNLVFSAIEASHVALAFAVASAIGLLVGTLGTVYLFRLQIGEVLGR